MSSVRSRPGRSRALQNTPLLAAGFFIALSIVYPAATKIANGTKPLEIRSWKPPTVPLLNLLIVENHRRLDREGDIDPDGLAVALIDVVEVRLWTEAEALRDGNTFAPGYFAWVIANVRPIQSPFRAQAERLIYRVTVGDEAQLILRQAQEDGAGNYRI